MSFGCFPFVSETKFDFGYHKIYGYKTTMSTSVEIIEVSSTDSSLEQWLQKHPPFKSNAQKVAIANIELVNDEYSTHNLKEPLFDEFILPTQKSSNLTMLSYSSSISTHSSDIQYIDCDGNNSSSSIDEWEQRIKS